MQTNFTTQKQAEDISVTDLRAKTNLARIIPELEQAQVVLVGEIHTSLGDHQNQLAVIQALRQHWSKMGIGLEFVQQPFQSVLDDYVSGKITEAQMLKQTEWYSRWRYDYRLYRDIFRFAREHRIPLFALNASAELTKKIRQSGIAGLGLEDRKQLPDNILRQDGYRDRMTAVFKQHGMKDPSRLERFIDVQLAWDESMAANTVKAIRSGRVNKMVVLAGSGHVIREAIPIRIEAALGDRPLILVNRLPEDPAQVDFVLSSPESKLPENGKIGILMEAADNGVRIAKVMESHTSGLQPGDIMTAIDAYPVESPEDVKIRLIDNKPGDTVKIELLRGRERQVKPVKLH